MDRARVPDVAIGIDLGTSSLKGVAIDRDGEVLARAKAGYPTDRPGPGRAEQDPDTWLAAFRDVVRRLGEEVDPGRWLGLGLSAMIPTLVRVDELGSVDGPAITWEDSRAEDQAERLRSRIGSDRIVELTGQRIDGRYLVPMAMWLAEHASAGTARPRRIIGAKDWLFGRLTGSWATDPSTAAGYGCYEISGRTWAEDVLAAAFGSQRPELPGIQRSSTSALSTDAATAAVGLAAGVPIVLGAADSILAARGLGVSEPGSLAVITGTSTVILGVTGLPRRTAFAEPAYLVTPLEHDAGLGLEMDLVSTGGAVRWLAGVLGLDISDEVAVWDLARASAPGGNDLVLLPFLGPGEQGALWDPHLRGALTGLTLSTTRADLARALLDGTILEIRRCVDVIEDATGSSGPIVIAGPAARSDVVRQALADATGRLVMAPIDPDHPASAWGAASVAWEALRRVVPATRGIDVAARPDPAARPLWDELMERHERTRAATTPLWRPPTPVRQTAIGSGEAPAPE